MTVGHNGITAIRNGRAVWEPNPCRAPHHNHPETLCTEPAGHYRPERDPHAGPLIIDGREIGAAAWDEPKEITPMADRPALEDLDAALARVRAALPPYDKPVYGDTGRGIQIGWDRARQAALDAIGGESPVQAPGVREVRIRVEAPTDENAASWAATIRDLVVAEYGQEMRLHVTITPGGQA